MTLTSLTPRSIPTKAELGSDPLRILDIAESEDEAYFIFAREPRAYWAYFFDIELEWFQREFVIAAELHHRLLGEWPAGHGKMLALATMLPTPTGWTTMGEVQVGDQLIDDNGAPCTVLNKGPVFYNHKCYAVRSGNNAPVIAGGEHLWSVKLDKRKPAKVHDTKWLYERTTGRRPIIDAAKAFRLPDRNLPLDPYVLGIWLGDGTSVAPCITEGTQDAQELIDNIRALGYDVGDARDTHGKACTFYIRGIVGILREMGVLGNKHIPMSYLRASTRQRTALLQGIVDTDGFVNKDGLVEVVSMRKELAEQIAELIRTLGEKASIYGGEARIGAKSYGPKHRVCFHHPEGARLKRRRELCCSGQQPEHYISIEEAGEYDAQCLEVDSPSHLFLAGTAMIPTHNSTNMSYVYPIWKICQNPNIRIIQIGKTTEEMDAYALLTRNTLEKSPKLNEWYGPFRDPDPSGRRLQQWSANGINVYKRQIDDPHMTIEWFGSNSDAALGHRCDILIPDDVVTPDTAGTPERRAKLKYRFREQWQTAPQYRFSIKHAPVTPYKLTDPMGHFAGYLQVPEGIFWPTYVEAEKILVVGTVFHHLDLYHELEKDETFHFIRHDCFVRGADGLMESLWPERWSMAKLEAERKSNLLSFNRRYRNICTSEEDLAFRTIYFEGGEDDQGHVYPGCLDRERSFGHRRSEWNVILSLDPASGTRSSDAAMPAMTVTGFDPADPLRKRFLIDIWSDYAGYFAVLDKALELHDRYQYGLFVVEINAFGKWLMDENAPQIKALKSRGVRIVPHTTGANKLDKDWGVKSMEPFFRDGLWSFPYMTPADQKKLEPYYEEFRLYPQGLTDYCMATWFTDLQIRKGQHRGGILKPRGGPIYSRRNVRDEIALRKAKRLAKMAPVPGRDN